MTLSDFLLPPPPMTLIWQPGSPFYRIGGVYVVWTKRYYYPSSIPVTDVLHVGQADDIADRLADHVRQHEAPDPVLGLLGLLGRPDLRLIWAAVTPGLRDGVENYVGNCLRPGGVYPDAIPVRVTLPVLL